MPWLFAIGLSVSAGLHKGARICLTCQHFTNGVDAHSRTMVACNLRQQQLQQSDHLIKRCRHWSPSWQDQAGWCPEYG